jgi:hypothetical protein
MQKDALVAGRDLKRIGDLAAAPSVDVAHRHDQPLHGRKLGDAVADDAERLVRLQCRVGQVLPPLGGARPSRRRA